MSIWSLYQISLFWYIFIWLVFVYNLLMVLHQPSLARTESRNKKAEIWQNKRKKDVDFNRGIFQHSRPFMCVFMSVYMWTHITQFVLTGAMQIISIRVHIILPLLSIIKIWRQTGLFICEEAFSGLIYSWRWMKSHTVLYLNVLIFC